MATLGVAIEEVLHHHLFWGPPFFVQTICGCSDMSRTLTYNE